MINIVNHTIVKRVDLCCDFFYCWPHNVPWRAILTQILWGSVCVVFGVNGKRKSTKPRTPDDCKNRNTIYYKSTHKKQHETVKTVMANDEQKHTKKLHEIRNKKRALLDDFVTITESNFTAQRKVIWYTRVYCVCCGCCEFTSNAQSTRSTYR